MQVQHDPGARRAGRGERAPAERRVDVVGVDDARAGPPHRGRDLPRLQAAREQARRGLGTADRGRVALEDLDLLAEVLADEPGELLDDALLAAGHAVAVVQEEDHAAGEATLLAPDGPARQHRRPDPQPPALPRRGARLDRAAGGSARRGGGRDRRRPRPRDARGRATARRALRRPRRPPRDQRRAQHGHRRHRGAAAGLRRRRRRGRPRLARSAAAGGRHVPGRGRRPRRPDPPADRRPPLPLVRPRGPADHVPRPRPGGRRHDARLGRELRRAPERARGRRALRRGPRQRRRRGGVAGALGRPRRPDPVRRRRRCRPPPRRATTPACARSPARPTTAAAPRGASASSAASGRRSRPSCACWPAACCTGRGTAASTA